MIDAVAPREAHRPIRVLMVEDVATDAELELREMRRAGLRIEHRTADREETFLALLADFAPDVIISDFSMPHFDGMAALELARERAPDVPFIFVSGTIGEEYAIRALKNGATDYVLKSNLVRLPAVVERALQDAKDRAARLEAESMFREVLEHAPDPMLVVEQDGRIVLANGQAERVFGYPRAQLIGMPVEALVPEAARERHAALRTGFHAGATARRMSGGLRLSAVHRDGRRIPVEISLAPLGSPSSARVVATIRDQTEQRAQEERIARLARIRDLLGAASAAFMRARERAALYEEFCRIAVARGGFTVARIVQKDEQGRLGVAATTEAAVDPMFAALVEAYNADPAGAQSLLAHALGTGRVIVSNDVSADMRVPVRDQLTASGNYSLIILPVGAGGRGAAAAILRAKEANFFDQEEVALLTELVSNLEFALELDDKQRQLNYLALYDPLTGLPNRTLFQDRLTQAIEAARRGGAMLSLTVFDIERFRAINDAYGQSAGDEVLRTVARRMRDVVGDVNRVARLGGNLFAVMRPDLQEASDAVRALQEGAGEIIDRPLRVAGREIQVGAKAGIALFPDDGADAEALFRNAEASLKRAKETGERYLYYAPHINARVSEQVDLENRLRRAVEQRELFLYYQPKVGVDSRRISGLEALMRWRGPDGQLVSPARFVPVLEETGLILEAGRIALEVAAAQHRDWRAAGVKAPRIAVNLSALQLRQRSFVKDVLDAVGGPAHGIDLEVTESLLMADVDESMRKLRELREAGASIALDDFGTGYSSLAYLSRLPIDTVKIDRAFVHAMTENADATSIVSTIISLAQALRLSVVAEGVQTEEQARLLRLLRCDQMQGYLYSPPQPADRIEALLRAAEA